MGEGGGGKKVKMLFLLYLLYLFIYLCLLKMSAGNYRYFPMETKKVEKNPICIRLNS